MKEVAPGVFHLQCLPALPYAVNAYLVEDVLIDSGARQSGKRILEQIGDRPVSAHALTHAHPDHTGSSRKISTELGLPYWCPEDDAPLAEDIDRMIQSYGNPRHPVSQIFIRSFKGPAHRVDRRLGEGDEVAGFRVIDAPGHSPGHVAYWRESDAVMILGDVLFNMHPLTGIPGLHLPKDYLTTDPVQNRDSARNLAALEPELVLFGHGAPLRDPRKLARFVESLPD